MHVQQAVGEVRFYACNVDPTLTISNVLMTLVGMRQVERGTGRAIGDGGRIDRSAVRAGGAHREPLCVCGA